MKKEQASQRPAELFQEADRSCGGSLVKGETLPFSEEEWQRTPEAVRVHLLVLCAQIEELKRQVEHLETRLPMDSGNSNKPPSSDSPFQGKNRPHRNGPLAAPVPRRAIQGTAR